MFHNFRNVSWIPRYSLRSLSYQSYCLTWSPFLYIVQSLILRHQLQPQVFSILLFELFQKANNISPIHFPIQRGSTSGARNKLPRRLQKPKQSIFSPWEANLSQLQRVPLIIYIQASPPPKNQAKSRPHHLFILRVRVQRVAGHTPLAHDNRAPGYAAIFWHLVVVGDLGWYWLLVFCGD